MAIPRFHWDMRVFMRCVYVCWENLILIQKQDHLPCRLCRDWMISVKNGKQRKTLATLYMGLRWNLPHISLQSVFRSDLESFRELQIRTILRTAIMCMCQKRSMPSASSSSRRISRSCHRAERSAMWRFRICRTTFRR